MAQAQVLFSLSSAGGLVTNHPVSMRIQLLVLKSTPKAIHGSAALTDVSESLDPLRSPKKKCSACLAWQGIKIRENTARNDLTHPTHRYNLYSIVLYRL